MTVAFARCSILAVMESLRRDLRYGLVSLRRTPGLTLTVLLTLALGVGSTTAVFTVVHAVLLEPLPYPDSAQLVRLWEEHRLRELRPCRSPGWWRFVL